MAGSHKLRGVAVIRLPNDSLTITVESVVIEVLLLGITVHMLRRRLKVELVLLWRHEIGLRLSHMVVLSLTVQLYLYGLNKHKNELSNYTESHQRRLKSISSKQLRCIKTNFAVLLILIVRQFLKSNNQRVRILLIARR